MHLFVIVDFVINNNRSQRPCYGLLKLKLRHSNIYYNVTSLLLCFGHPPTTMMPFWPPLLPADKPTSIKHRGQYKHIDFYINLLNLTKPFDSGLKKWMRKAACHSDSVDSSNPHRWRGKWLHHHGGGVCWLFVLLWMDSWGHKLIVCKKWYKHNLKMKLMALLFDPPRRAPHRYCMNSQISCNSI